MTRQLSEQLVYDVAEVGRLLNGNNAIIGESE